MLVIRGPGPDCDVAGRIPVAGRPGANRLNFDGRIRNRRLQAGTYMLVAQMKGTREPLARTYVTIDAPGPSRTPRILPQCSPSAAPGTALAPAALAPFGNMFTDVFAGGNDSQASYRGSQEGHGAVLGAQTSPKGAFVFALPGLERPEGVAGFLAFLLFALLIGSLLGVVVSTIQHLRDPRT